MLTSVTQATRPSPSANRKMTVAAGGGETVQAGGFHALDRFIPNNAGSLINTGTMLGRVGNAVNTATKGGAEALPNVQAGFTALKGFDISGLWNAGMALGKTALSWGEKSAMIQGALSLVGNGYRALTHQESYADAGTNVVMDTTSGMAGGAAGAIAGGLGTMALTALGVAGGPLTIGAAVIGMGGYFLGETFFKNTSIYRKIQDTVSSVMHSAFRPLSV